VARQPGHQTPRIASSPHRRPLRLRSVRGMHAGPVYLLSPPFAGWRQSAKRARSNRLGIPRVPRRRPSPGSASANTRRVFRPECRAVRPALFGPRGTRRRSRRRVLQRRSRLVRHGQLGGGSGCQLTAGPSRASGILPRTCGQDTRTREEPRDRLVSICAQFGEWHSECVRQRECRVSRGRACRVTTPEPRREATER
jgi:hypothetical protein